MKRILALFFLFALCGLPSLQASRAETIKQNMIERRPQIQAMKRKGLIGEDHLGYLAVVKESLQAEDKKIFEEENKDRKEVYETIAKRQGSNARNVGQIRAKKIFEQARSGDYLKDESGSWKKK